MNKDKQRDFARRVTQANRGELLVITYDILLEEIESSDKSFKDGDIDGYRHSLKIAQRFIAELMSTLDFSYPVSKELFALYEYVQRLLIKSDISGEPCGLESVTRVISGLRKSFAKLAEEDHSEPLMENTQSVFAGLTYGRQSLNETDLDPNMANRGFLA